MFGYLKICTKIETFGKKHKKIVWLLSSPCLSPPVPCPTKSNKVPKKEKEEGFGGQRTPITTPPHTNARNILLPHMGYHGLTICVSQDLTLSTKSLFFNKSSRCPNVSIPKFSQLYSSSISAFSVRQTILLLYFRTAPVWRYLSIPA